MRIARPRAWWCCNQQKVKGNCAAWGSSWARDEALDLGDGLQEQIVSILSETVECVITPCHRSYCYVDHPQVGQCRVKGANPKIRQREPRERTILKSRREERMEERWTSAYLSIVDLTNARSYNRLLALRDRVSPMPPCPRSMVTSSSALKEGSEVIKVYEASTKPYRNNGHR